MVLAGLALGPLFVTFYVLLSELLGRRRRGARVRMGGDREQRRRRGGATGAGLVVAALDPTAGFGLACAGGALAALAAGAAFVPGRSRGSRG